MIAFDANNYVEVPDTALSISQPILATKMRRSSSSPPIIPKVIIKCSECIFEMDSSDGLKAHQDELHGYECEECGKTFPCIDDRQNHFVEEHTTRPSHQCSVCDALYAPFAQQSVMPLSMLLMFIL